MYSVPDKYFFRIHHVRPRFKDDVESVLFYIANKICNIGKEDRLKFKEDLNKAIYQFPGNINKSEKTINNWRTEISSLFGFFIEQGQTVEPGEIAQLLADNGDIPQMFNYFLYKFQYPGAHLKASAIQEQIQHHVKFQPAKSILNILTKATEISPDQPFLTISECTHCIFNDLRCTRINHESYSDTWNRILSNRNQKVIYDKKGDITRYAKDILDYMRQAGLLNESNNAFYLNDLSKDSIRKIMDSSSSFTGYDDFIRNGSADLNEINNEKFNWFKYVNDISGLDLSTDVYAYMAHSLNVYNKEKESIEAAIRQSLNYQNTKEIGDQGEGLVYKYETDNVIRNGRGDLVHLITFIPTRLAVGYDFNSIEPENELRRYIEVKSTISSSRLRINSFHMTPNEVRTARTVGTHYFIYRLKIMRDKRPTLVIINDPISLIKKNELVGDLNDVSNGIDVVYNPDKFEEIII